MYTYLDCGENVRTPHGIVRVWPKPDKVPAQEQSQSGDVPIQDVVHSRVFVSVYNESTFGTAIRSLSEWHSNYITTSTTHLGRTAFIYNLEIFPVFLALVDQHLQEIGERLSTASIIVLLLSANLDKAVMQNDKDWAVRLRESRHIGDFTNWQDDAAYQEMFAQLLRDLKVSKPPTA